MFSAVKDAFLQMQNLHFTSSCASYFTRKLQTSSFKLFENYVILLIKLIFYLDVQTEHN